MFAGKSSARQPVHCREQGQCVTRAPNTAKPPASPHRQSHMRLHSALQSTFKQSTLPPRHRTRLHTLSPLQPNPHSAAPLIVPNRPRVPSLAAFGRRPRCQPPPPQWGRRPKPITEAEALTTRMSANQLRPKAMRSPTEMTPAERTSARTPPRAANASANPVLCTKAEGRWQGLVP